MINYDHNLAWLPAWSTQHPKWSAWSELPTSEQNWFRSSGFVVLILSLKLLHYAEVFFIRQRSFPFASYLKL